MTVNHDQYSEPDSRYGAFVTLIGVAFPLLGASALTVSVVSMKSWDPAPAIPLAAKVTGYGSIDDPAKGAALDEDYKYALH